MKVENLGKNELISPPKSLTSIAWKHFKFTKNKLNTVCNYCEAEVPYKGQTTNMFTHLRRHHPTIPTTASDCQRPPATTASSTSFDVSSSSSSPSGLAPIFATSKLPPTSARAQMITKSICDFIVQDMRPFSLVESKSFKAMVLSLDPRYRIPGRQHFSEIAVPKLYNDIKSKVIALMSKASRVALTTDGWTSRETMSYITITCHLLVDWDMVNFVLQTRVIEESHTGENIGVVLKEAIKEWSIVDPDPALVTDNAANMYSAVRSAKLSTHIGCFAHTLNLATQKGLKINSVSRLLGKVRSVVKFFTRSTSATTVLVRKQELLELPKLKLKIDVPTRWNSTYDMVERYLQIEPAIYAAYTCMKKDCKDKEALLSDSDNALLRLLVQVLLPMKKATTVMCEESVPTVSVIAPLLSRLLNFMEPSDEDKPLIKDVKKTILTDLNARYQDDSVKEVLHVSAALDPRFKSLAFLDNERKQDIISLLSVKATRHHAQVNHDS